MFFKWHEGAESRVLYRRAGSAASRLRPTTSRRRHSTERASCTCPVSPWLSRTPPVRPCSPLLTKARARGITITFDPNYRPALWPGPREAEARQRQVLPLVDWYLCGEHEGCLLFGVDSAAGLLEAVRVAGASEVAVRVGARGAVVWAGGEPSRCRPYASRTSSTRSAPAMASRPASPTGCCTDGRPSVCARPATSSRHMPSAGQATGRPSRSSTRCRRT